VDPSGTQGFSAVEEPEKGFLEREHDEVTAFAKQAGITNQEAREHLEIQAKERDKELNWRRRLHPVDVPEPEAELEQQNRPLELRPLRDTR
jgi:hypothetical protein